MKALCTALLAVALFAGAVPGSATETAGTPAASATVALQGLDPVLLVAGKEQPGSAELALDRGRFRYLFATAENRARFAAAPEAFEIQRGGQCGTMPQATGNPDFFAVHDGRIYVFGSPGCREEFVANPTLFVAGGPPRRVAILVFDGVELLDFAGPGEVFAAAGHGRAFEVFTVGETRAPIVSQGFVEVTPRHAIADSPPPDVLVIPGGGVHSVLDSPALMQWIKSTAATATVMSVCNGAFVLAQAGLLDGLEATTHHASIDALRRAAPRTVLRPGERFVDNGRVITAAGVAAGIDAALYVVGRLLTPNAAERTADYMEYRWSAAEQAPRQARQAGSEGGR